MKSALKSAALLAVLAACVAAGSVREAQADYGYTGRQYYGGWSNHPTNNYYYRPYYYKPTPKYQGYRYHYCVHYPAQPRYVYYYNRYEKTYWGRCDLEGKDGHQYSILAKEDRKANLDEIPEKAFPKPGAMPNIPEAADDVKIEVVQDLPVADLPPGLPAN